MTKKQRRFVEEYLIDLNATQAAIRAGYSPKTANEQGAQNLAKVSIRAAIDRAIAERSRRTGINQDRVLIELAKIAFLNPVDVIDPETSLIKADASRDDTAAIAGIRIKTFFSKEGPVIEREIKFCDKLKALELLGKHLGMFTDKLKFENVVPVVIVDDIPAE